MGVSNGDGVSAGPGDDTMELVRAFAGGGTRQLDAGRTYRVRTVPITVPSTRLIIPATTVVEVHSNRFAGDNSLYVTAANVVIEGGGTIRGTSTTRTGVYGLIRAEDADNLNVSGITIHSSPSNAVWVKGGNGLVLSTLTIHSTAADGIQVTRGATGFQVVDNTIYDTSDDGVGVNSYSSHVQCSGTVARNTISNVTLGRGIAVNGGDGVAVDANSVTGTDQAAIIVSRVTGETHDPANVTTTDNVLATYGRNPPTGGTTAAIYYAHVTTGSITGNTGNGVAQGDIAVDVSCSGVTVG